MLEKVVLCLSSNTFTLVELGKDYDHHRFVPSPSLDLKNLADLIKSSNAKVQILLMPDYADQKFITEQLPFSSYIGVNDLVQKIQFSNQGYQYEISESFFIKKQNKKFFYSFAFINLSVKIKEFIKQINSVFCGFASAFLESRKIFDSVFGCCGKGSKGRVLLLHSQMDKLIVVYANKYSVPIKSKEVHLEHSSPACIAGSIMQKIEDVAYEEKEILDFAVVASKKIQETILQSGCTTEKLILLAPYEVAILLKIENFFDPEEEYCSLLFAHNLLLGKKTNLMLSKAKKKEALDAKNNRIANYLNFIVLSFLTASILFFEGRMTSYQEQNQEALQILEIAEKDLERANLKVSEELKDEKFTEKKDIYRFFKNYDQSFLKKVKNIIKDIQLSYIDYRSDARIYDEGGTLVIKAGGISKLDQDALEELLKKYYRDYKVSAQKDGAIFHLKISHDQN